MNNLEKEIGRYWCSLITTTGEYGFAVNGVFLSDEVYLKIRRLGWLEFSFDMLDNNIP